MGNHLKPAIVVCVILLSITAAPAMAQWIQNGNPICTEAGGQLRPQVCSDGAAGAIVTWFDLRSADRDIYAQSVDEFGALRWPAAGVAISTASNDQRDPCIISDGVGGAFIVWMDYRSLSNWDVYAQRIDATGNVLWTPDGVAICTAMNDQFIPRLCSDGAGGVIFAWYDHRDGPADVYAQRVDANGNALWIPDGVEICTAAGNQGYPRPSTDGAGGAIITWFDERNGIDRDVYAQRVDASGFVQWAVDGEAVCTAAYDQFFPKIISDGTGGAIITWTDERTTTGGQFVEARDIYAQRLDALGVAQWTTQGVALCTAPNEQDGTAIVSDGAGGAIVSWFDQRTGPYFDDRDIYAQRIDATGTVLWTANGVALCTEPLQQFGTNAVSDESGGAIVSWQDSRNGTNDVYAQRIDGVGTIQWTAGGVAICTDALSQHYENMTPDGAGGVVIVWQDERFGTEAIADVYAQRMSASGQIMSPLISVEPAFANTNCSSVVSFDFWYDSLGFTGEVRGYEITFSITPSTATIVDPMTDIVEGTFLDSAEPATFFPPIDNGGGSYTVVCVIIGGTVGATGAGDLFRIDLSPVAQGTCNIVIDDIDVRDVNNIPILTAGRDGVLKVDCTPPTMDAIVEDEGEYYNQAPVFTTFRFSDNENLDLADYQIDVAGWQSIFSGIDAVEYTDHGFVLPGFGGLSEGSHTVYFRVKDDVGNWNAGTISWQFFGDLTHPTMDPITDPEDKYYNQAPVLAALTFRDESNLHAAQFRVDAGGWQVLFDGIDATEHTSSNFTLPGFAGLSEGSHTVYFRVWDDAGNSNGVSPPDPVNYSWRFIKDTVPPAAPATFSALPGHRKVHLTWTNPTGDPSFKDVVIRRTRWYDYPEYDSPPPAYPADEASGNPVTRTDAESYDDPMLLRDIYYYAAFSCDNAGNYSAYAEDATDRSTNYWLGDIDHTGEVDAVDCAVLTGAFNTQPGDPGWIPECDIGPSDPAKHAIVDDASRYGVPEPDDLVRLDDIVILGMNFERVTPTTSSAFIVAESPQQLEELVSFGLTTSTVHGTGEDVVVTLTIQNQAMSLKGFSVIVEYGAEHQIVDIEQGSFAPKGSNRFFGVNTRERGTADICVVAMGYGLALSGSGEVARIRFRTTAPTPLQLSVKYADLRNIYNQKEIVEAPVVRETPFIPTVSALLHNYPNPFNPRTTITYDISIEGHVEIDIFDVIGRLVRRLVDTHKGVGRHQASWDGTDSRGVPASTGMYFYRMRAPDYTSPPRKMLLLK